MDCAIDGTVNEANREVLAFDNTGAAGVVSIVVGFVANLDSVGAVFDAMTMGVFNFDSTFVGLDSAFVFADMFAVTAFTAFTAFTGFVLATKATAFLASFLVGTATTFMAFDLTAGLVTGFATGLTGLLTIAFDADLAIGFLTALIDDLAGVLATGLTTAFAALTVFLATTLTATLLTALGGAFLIAFFVTVFIRCLPDGLDSLQIKHQLARLENHAFTLKLLRIYSNHMVTH